MERETVSNILLEQLEKLKGCANKENIYTSEQIQIAYAMVSVAESFAKLKEDKAVRSLD